MSTLHLHSGKLQLPPSWTWPGFAIVTTALVLWNGIIKPLTWWFFRSGYLQTATDEMLQRDGIRDPRRERIHILLGGLVFITAAVLLWLCIQQPQAWSVAGFLLAVLFYVGLTWAYYRNEQENMRYPPTGAHS